MRVDQRGAARRRADVAGDAMHRRRAGLGGQAGDGALDGLRLAPVHHHLGAGADERPRDGQADPGRRSGDDGLAAGEKGFVQTVPGGNG
jgi:hypothetical protein